MKITWKWLVYVGLALGVALMQGCGDDEDGFRLDDAKILTPGKGNANFEYELVKLTTTRGDIILWLYYQTPKHRENFLKLSQDGFYNGKIFHRVIDDFVIQGGDPQGNGSGGPGYELDQEIKSFLPHVRGAVGAARTSDQINPLRRSNGSQFYIVEAPQGTPFLDLAYTVFGIVVDGMTTVSTIASVATDSSDKPLTDVVITKAEVVKFKAVDLKTSYNFDVPFLE